MKTRARIPLLVVTLASVCCGGTGSTTSPSVQTLAGTWKATKAEFVSAANRSLRVEVVGKGTTVILTLDASGTYTLNITDPGEPGQTTTGAWSSSKDVLTLKLPASSGEMQFDMTLSGTTLTLNGGHVIFDVNLDGYDEEALAYLTLTRQ